MVLATIFALQDFFETMQFAYDSNENDSLLRDETNNGRPLPAHMAERMFVHQLIQGNGPTEKCRHLSAHLLAMRFSSNATKKKSAVSSNQLTLLHRVCVSTDYAGKTD